MQQSVQGPSAGRVSANQACKCQKLSIVPFKVWSTYDNDEVGKSSGKRWYARSLSFAYVEECAARKRRYRVAQKNNRLLALFANREKNWPRIGSNEREMPIFGCSTFQAAD